MKRIDPRIDRGFGTACFQTKSWISVGSSENLRNFSGARVMVGCGSNSGVAAFSIALYSEVELGGRSRSANVKAF